MRGHKVWPVSWEITVRGLKSSSGPCAESSGDTRSSKDQHKMPILPQSSIQLKTKATSSPVLPFEESVEPLEGLSKQQCNHNSSSDAGRSDLKALLAGIMRTKLVTSGNQASTSRKLQRQCHSLPSRSEELKSPPLLRRCISTGEGGTTRSSASGRRNGSTEKREAYTDTRAPLPISTSLASPSTTAASTPSLLDALQSVTDAASSTACALSSVRQQHEEALQKQREQFQRLMEGMRMRSLQLGADGQRTSASSLTTPRGGGFSTGSPGGSQTPATPSPQQAEVLSTTHTYRGVQFTVPVGCQIESGEAPSEVLVLGSQVHVVLDFRDSGRNVVLVSSNCVCTVKKMDGQTVVNVLSPLTARLRSVC